MSFDLKHAVRVIQAGAILAGSSVMIGAWGAHRLESILTPQEMNWFHTAMKYQFFHSFGLILSGILAELGFLRKRPFQGATIGFLGGIFFFCGSLYALSLGLPRSVASLSPIGGVCFLLGWVFLSFLKTKDVSQ